MELAVAAGGDDQVLLAIEGVGHRGGLAACGKLVPPELLAGLRVEGPQEGIHGRGREHESACRYHGSSETDRARFLARNQRPERNIPELPAGKEVDGLGRAPRRGVAGQLAGGKQESPIEAVGRRRLVRKLTE